LQYIDCDSSGLLCAANIVLAIDKYGSLDGCALDVYTGLNSAMTGAECCPDWVEYCNDWG